MTGGYGSIVRAGAETYVDMDPDTGQWITPRHYYQDEQVRRHTTRTSQDVFKCLLTWIYNIAVILVIIVGIVALAAILMIPLDVYHKYHPNTRVATPSEHHFVYEYPWINRTVVTEAAAATTNATATTDTNINNNIYQVNDNGWQMLWKGWQFSFQDTGGQELTFIDVQFGFGGLRATIERNGETWAKINESWRNDYISVDVLPVMGKEEEEGQSYKIRQRGLVQNQYQVLKTIDEVLVPVATIIQKYETFLARVHHGFFPHHFIYNIFVEDGEVDDLLILCLSVVLDALDVWRYMDD